MAREGEGRRREAAVPFLSHLLRFRGRIVSPWLDSGGNLQAAVTPVVSAVARRRVQRAFMATTGPSATVIVNLRALTPVDNRFCHLAKGTSVPLVGIYANALIMIGFLSSSAACCRFAYTYAGRGCNFGQFIGTMAADRDPWSFIVD